MEKNADVYYYALKAGKISDILIVEKAIIVMGKCLLFPLLVQKYNILTFVQAHADIKKIIRPNLNINKVMMVRATVKGE